MDGFPSYVIRGIQLPEFVGNKWEGVLELECYNPIEAKLEKAAITLVSKEEVKITIKVLNATAVVDTTWEITATDGTVEFGSYNWRDEGNPNMLLLRFSVKDAKVIY